MKNKIKCKTFPLYFLFCALPFFSLSAKWVDDDGHTKLHLAIIKGDLNAFKKLYLGGASEKAQDNAGNMALHLAAKYNRLKMIDLLLLDPKGNEKKEESKEDDFDAFKAIKKRAKAPLNAPNNWGNTPLHLAIEAKNKAATKKLLAHGASPYISRDDGYAPIHLAASLGSAKIIEWLIAEGVDPNSKMVRGRRLTPLELAAEGGHCPAIAALLKAGAKDSNAALAEAAFKGQVQAIKLLLKAENKAVAQNPNAACALFSAIENGQITAAKYLFKAGADINGVYRDKTSAFLLVIKKGEMQLFDLFFEKRRQKKDINYQLAVHTAVESNQLDILKILLQKNFPFDTCKKISWYDSITPLYLAILRKRPTLAKYLIEKGADLDKACKKYPESDSNTPRSLIKPNDFALYGLSKNPTSCAKKAFYDFF